MRILVINPGSTSTKIAVFEGDRQVWTAGAHHPVSELARFERVTDQYAYRRDFVLGKLRDGGIECAFDAVIGRGGLLKPRVEYRRGDEVVLEIEALPIMWTVKAGNALRLDIKSSQFPEYAVHSNTAGVWAEQARTVVARQTVFVGGEDGSRVVFPVLK